MKIPREMVERYVAQVDMDLIYPSYEAYIDRLDDLAFDLALEIKGQLTRADFLLIDVLQDLLHQECGDPELAVIQ